MDIYKIEVKPSIEKDLRKIPHQYIGKIIQEIENLSTNPYPTGTVKLTATENTYRFRVGNYRVIYQVIKSERTIIVHHIRHRKEAYR